MFAVFRVVLLTAFVTVLRAEFEYSLENVNKLIQPFQDIPQKGEGNLKLVNENVNVFMERRNPGESFANEIDFHVANKYFDDQINNPRPHIQPECNGLPGLRVKFPPKRSKTLGCIPSFSKLPSQERVYCYTGMTFEIVRFSKEKPTMEIGVKFFHAGSQDYLFISIPVFTTPKEQSGEDHAKENNVLRDLFPIPLKEFESPGLKPRRKGEEERHSFVGDISWLKKVIPRAKHWEDKHEWYYPGPVIIDPELLKKIINLDHTFRKHAFGKERENRSYYKLVDNTILV